MICQIYSQYIYPIYNKQAELSIAQFCPRPSN